MKQNKLLGITLPMDSREEILEKIIKDAKNHKRFTMVFSLNPEIFVAMENDSEFKKVAREAQIRINDGAGIVLAARINGMRVGDRYTGVDLMEDVLKEASKHSLRVMLIGGGPKLAEELAECYSKKYPRLSIFGIQGIKDISNPTENEERAIFSIVADRKPHIVFVAFGSPFQEKWLYRNQAHFQGMVVAGVGGAFDFLSGRVPRAPRFVRLLGLEWLFRLIIQPWRIKRQLRLLTFIRLVLRQRLNA